MLLLLGADARFSVSALLVAVLLVCGSALAAQDPPPLPRDTLPRDTLAVEPDTGVFVVPPAQLPADTLPERVDTVGAEADTVLPAPNLPLLSAPAAGFASARWVWTREELQRFHGFSLLDLLADIPIPALTLTRAGGIGRPAGLAAFGSGGGRVRVFLDGYELDPFVSANRSLQQISLVDLRELRIERGLLETRIELFTFRLEESRPLSVLEAATGDFETQILRVLFARTLGDRQILTVGFDVRDTDGLARVQPFTATSGIARWSYRFDPQLGVEAEFRQTGAEWADTVGLAGVGLASPLGFAESSTRRDVLLRVRAQPRPALFMDALVGRSWRDPAEADSFGVGRSVSNQAAARAAYVGDRVWATSSARVRGGVANAFPVPSVDLAARAGVRPLGGVAAEGELRYASTEGVGGAEFSVGGRLGPLLGFSLFATVAGGSRPLGFLRDSVVFLPPAENPEGEVPPDTAVIEDTLRTFGVVESAVGGLRAGAEWRGLGATVGGALLSVDADRIAPFALPFDRGAGIIEGEAARGVEAFASSPLVFPALRLEASWTRWMDTGGRPYLPEQEWRAALVFHDIFYTGNLEPTLRVEAVHRGAALVPGPEGEVFSDLSEPYTLSNLFLQIRVIDVQAFVRWENLLNLRAADLPGRIFPGQRVLFGVRWRFQN